MSWRLLLRLAGLLVAGRVAARARARSRSGGPKRVSRADLRRRLADLRRDAGIVGRLFSLVGFLAVAGALITAGTSSALLAPRWLGIALLLLGLGVLGAALVEARGLHRAVARRRLERRDRDLRRDL